ncbi:MAG: site-specific integrase [Cyanobacteria bacterium P01_A01_bin.84]
MSLDLVLKAVNSRLKAGNIGVSVEQVGKRLYLRATLPPKPNSKRRKQHQQRIKLDIYANKQGVKQAEAEARKLGGLLACREFNWEFYQTLADDSLDAHYVSDWVKRFEKYYFETRERNHQTETTWKTDYFSIFRKMPQDKVLNEDLIMSVVKETAPDTKTRKRACMALTVLAKYAGIDIDLKRYRGKYNPRKVTPRNLPTDIEIATQFYKIENQSWRWVFGMLATYGLRNHEVFRLDLTSLKKGDRAIRVGENSKTGTRLVYPYYPEWFEEFQLSQVKLPNINLDRPNADIGHVVTVWFHRNIGFKPYDLRHCWAIRTLNFGLKDTLAAKQMGHSVKVHQDLYHHWIDERYHQQAFEEITARSERPRAPSVGL